MIGNNFDYESPFGAESLFNLEAKQSANILQPLSKTKQSLRSRAKPKNTREKNPKLKYGLQVKTEDGKTLPYFDRNIYEKGIIYIGNDPFVVAVRDALNSLLISPTANKIINDLQHAEELFPESPVRGAIIHETTKKGEVSSALINKCSWNYKNPFAVKLEGKKEKADATINLIHELGHVYRYNRGEEVENNTLDDWGLLQEEEEETSHLENKVRAEMNKPLRLTYSGEPIIDNSGKRVYKNPNPAKPWDYRLEAKKIKK